MIDNPMDLGKVRKKLDNLQYDDVISFISDVNIIFKNCQKFFKVGLHELPKGVEVEGREMNFQSSLPLSLQTLEF